VAHPSTHAASATLKTWTEAG